MAGKGIEHEFFDKRKVIVEEQDLNEAMFGKENEQKSEKQVKLLTVNLYK